MSDAPKPDYQLDGWIPSDDFFPRSVRVYVKPVNSDRKDEIVQGMKGLLARSLTIKELEQEARTLAEGLRVALDEFITGHIQSDPADSLLTIVFGPRRHA